MIATEGQRLRQYLAVAMSNAAPGVPLVLRELLENAAVEALTAWLASPLLAVHCSPALIGHEVDASSAQGCVHQSSHDCITERALIVLAEIRKAVEA